MSVRAWIPCRLKSYSEKIIWRKVLNVKTKNYSEVSLRQNFFTAECPHSKIFYGETSHGKMYYDEVSHGEMPYG